MGWEPGYSGGVATGSREAGSYRLMGVSKRLSEMPLILTGVLVGATHVVLGPDHLAALAPFAAEAGRRAWVVGLRWGIGHALGVVWVGLAGYAAVDWLDVEWLFEQSERLMGVVLILIGAWCLFHLRQSRHANADPLRGAESETAGPLSRGHVHTRAALLVGVAHGVAGTGSVMGVLPAIAQPSWMHTGLYLASFGGGSILAMVGFAYVLGIVAAGDTPGRQLAYRRICVAAASACLILGVLWLAFPSLRFGVHG